jgi:hypothetical protein
MSQTPLERISWAVYCPFPGIRAYAEFSFAERGRKNGARYSKLKGRTYSAARYETPVEVLTVDVGTDDYLIFRHVDQKGDGPGKVVMSYPHLRRFVEGMQEALEMVRDDCFEEADGAYQLTQKGREAILVVEDMFKGAQIAFQPTVFTRVPDDELEDGQGDFNLAGEPGMRIYLDSNDVWSEITLDEFATFVQFYERFDLFATSRAAVQVAMAQLGGVPGVTLTKTPAPQPTRRPGAGTLNGLGPKKK